MIADNKEYFVGEDWPIEVEFTQTSASNVTTALPIADLTSIDAGLYVDDTLIEAFAYPAVTTETLAVIGESTNIIVFPSVAANNASATEGLEIILKLNFVIPDTTMPSNARRISYCLTYGKVKACR
jgi:hypothetical protein